MHVFDRIGAMRLVGMWLCADASSCLLFVADGTPLGNGSLTGDDPGNVTVIAGEPAKDLKCQLIPPGPSIPGRWVAYIEGERADILSINMTAGEALIRPANGSDVYTGTGTVVVRCVYLNDKNETVVEFNRTVNVTGECWCDDQLCVLE